MIHAAFFTLALWYSTASASTSLPNGFASPAYGGGQMLTFVDGTFPAGLGEPLNVIISGNSDSAVLVDQTDNGGLRNYFVSLNFSTECFGQHLGGDQAANLGDGNGTHNQTAVIRYDYGNPVTGTCQESVNGGNHFRYWTQNGSQNNTGAIFMAVSYEEDSDHDHDIIPNGYDFARDWLVGNATGQTTQIPTLDLQAVSNISSTSYLPSYSGMTSANGYTYKTSVSYLPGLLQNSSNGINHYLTVEYQGRPAIDGLVAVMDVKIASRPSGSSGGASLGSEATRLGASISALLAICFAFFLF